MTDDAATRPASRGHHRPLAVAVLLATVTLCLAGATPASAADCCTVARDGNNIVISGTVPYRGARYITSFIEHEDGWQMSGQRCTATASGQNAHVKITLPVKYVPNGVYRVHSDSANTDYTRYFITASTRFRVRNSPAVALHVKAAPPKLHKSDAATFRFATYGDVRKTQCQFDGQSWRGCDSPKTYTGLPDGRHTVRMRAVGAQGFINTATHRFLVDTLPPTPPKLEVEKDYSMAWVTPSGSRDASGIDGYEYQTFRDGEATSTITRDEFVRIEEDGTNVKWRAIDGAGRRSTWTQTGPISLSG